MSAVMSEPILDTDFVADAKVYAQTEEALRTWARERAQMRRSVERSLQVPQSSSMSHMVQQQRVFAKQRKLNPKRRAMRCPTCKLIYFGKDCRNCDALSVNNGVTARGSQTRSMAPPAMLITFTSRSATVSFIVKRLDGWMRVVVYAAYGQDLPDRIAARQLRMPREEFSRWRRAAVAAVAEQLAHRTERTAWKSYRPS